MKRILLFYFRKNKKKTLYKLQKIYVPLTSYIMISFCKIDVKFRQVLFEIGSIKSRNRLNASEISQYEECRFPLGGHQTPHTIADPAVMITDRLLHESYSPNIGFSAYFVVDKILLTRRNSILRKPVK